VARRLGQPLLDEVREAVARHALRRPLESTEIVLCPIASNPVSLGAATFALEGSLASVGQKSPKPVRRGSTVAVTAARTRSTPS
jgi:hypothetical protein